MLNFSGPRSARRGSGLGLGPRRAPKNRHGFTLIELLVSIGIFSVVVIIVAGAIGSIIEVNKKAQTVTSVVNNLNFTLEAMTRAFKTGSNLVVGDGNDVCADYVSLDDYRGRVVGYSFVEGSVSQAVDGVASPITAPEIQVTSLQFCRLDGQQPAILLAVSGFMELSAGNTHSEFRVQTSVAQRALEIRR